jgi:protein TonB
MEPKTLINADYLDIIFDNRNKTYGGYELRRNYNNRLRKAAWIVMLGAAAIFSFSFITVRHSDPVIRTNTQPTIISEVHIVPPQPPQIPHPATPPPPPQPINTRTFAIPKIVDNAQVPDDKQMTQNKDMHDAQPGTSDAVEAPAGPGSGNGEGSGPVSVVSSGNDHNIPVRWVAQMPLFPGDMNTYIARHLQYPEAASNSGIEGQVIIEFVVNEDGSVSNVKVLRGIGGGCDEEAVRMVSNMPAWKSGRQNGIPVKVLFTLPIRFVLN